MPRKKRITYLFFNNSVKLSFDPTFSSSFNSTTGNLLTRMTTIIASMMIANTQYTDTHDILAGTKPFNKLMKGFCVLPLSILDTRYEYICGLIKDASPKISCARTELKA